MADVEVRRHILAIAVGGEGACHTRVVIGDGDSGVGDCRASRIGYGADDGRFLSQALSREYYEKGCEENGKARGAASHSWAKTPGKHGREGFHVKPPNKWSRLVAREKGRDIQGRDCPSIP